MNAQHITVAQACLDAAFDGTRSFPEIAGLLIASGFDGYAVDYRRSTTTYFLPDGDSVVLENRPSGGAVALAFDQARIAEQVKWAQSGALDYSYPAFSRNVKEAGCAGYLVSFPGERVLYFGRTAETHVEHFPR
jgi:uncharacterized protein YbcV (DUF1398 family)